MSNSQSDSKPDALILVAPGCPYCPTVLRGLEMLKSKGQIGELQIVDITKEPDKAASLGVRSVPWTRIGDFEFQGLYSEKELSKWAIKASKKNGLSDYFEHMLNTGSMQQVLDKVGKNWRYLEALLRLLERQELELNTRLGISAVIEGLQDSAVLGQAVDQLGELSKSENSQLRIDVCHYLGLTGNSRAIVYVESLLKDENPDVREIAKESLERLIQGSKGKTLTEESV